MITFYKLVVGIFCMLFSLFYQLRQKLLIAVLQYNKHCVVYIYTERGRSFFKIKHLDTILIEIKSHPEKLDWDAEDLISLTNTIGIKS